ncbi:MAG: hypothetical protein IPF92_14045 [Myxococcales bacterium]|jgi:membrane associated rhomboid family serine protease|nr:hypothetical protein [Myxococcales bacterium]MBL0194999.1 hypothetical protein [Myxococcales bacterium]HQY60391.1 rhomboid family intramembrane serine protease [Polyangiaceae bacterium]
MDSVLTRLERRLGRFAIPNLTAYVVGGMAIAFVLGIVRPEIVDAMALDFAAIRAGQVWRLVSYIFLPGTTTSPIFLLFQLGFTWFVGRTLESEWGPFKLNAYYLLGMFGTTVAAWLTGGSPGNLYLNTSLFFAFATLFPNQQVTLYLLIPVRVKWLALLSLGLLGFSFATGSWATRAGILAALANYLLFFAPTLIGFVRARQGAAAGERRRASMRPAEAPAAARACAECGATEGDGADIRVCSCAKCGVPTTFCLEHARNH